MIARNIRAVVYRAHPAGAEIYEYRGCVYGSRRSFRLGIELVSGSPYASFGVRNVTLAGSTVAYESERSNGTGEFERSERYVLVTDLRTGGVLHKVPTGASRHPELKVIGAGEVRAIVAKSDGTVAWVNDTVQAENRFEVHALDKTGERVLAVGSNIVPTSLALAGSTLYWTQGGKPFSATLN